MPDWPINSKGSYNLNFIDWNNEWERISDIYDDNMYNQVSKAPEIQSDLVIPKTNKQQIISAKRLSKFKDSV